ncbi:hypothetical protein [Methylobacterium sp. GC_Met_2]|uniref:hypothetical protein n=1 Tax=Methylobacterium sp. GC_Met_2 TaxID=2937376 RepID=UPI00226B538E|nr:hypothetical protein [Methylobacterium sp. GC_Met_2]
MAGKTCDPQSKTPSSKAVAQLRQIAGALQLPLSVLFDLPEQRDAAIERSDSTAFSTSNMSIECVALLRAYSSVRDPTERQRLLKLVQAAAEQA